MKRSRVDIAIENARKELAFYQRLIDALESTREAQTTIVSDRPTRGRGRPKKAPATTPEVPSE